MNNLLLGRPGHDVKLPTDQYVVVMKMAKGSVRGVVDSGIGYIYAIVNEYGIYKSVVDDKTVPMGRKWLPRGEYRILPCTSERHERDSELLFRVAWRNGVKNDDGTLTVRTYHVVGVERISRKIMVRYKVPRADSAMHCPACGFFFDITDDRDEYLCGRCSSEILLG